MAMRSDYDRAVQMALRIVSSSCSCDVGASTTAAVANVSPIPAKKFLDEYFILSTFITWHRHLLRRTKKLKGTERSEKIDEINLFKLLEYLLLCSSLPNSPEHLLETLKARVDALQLQWASFEQSMQTKLRPLKDPRSFNAWKLVHMLQNPLRHDQEMKKAASNAESILLELCRIYQEACIELKEMDDVTRILAEDEGYRVFTTRDQKDLLAFHSSVDSMADCSPEAEERTNRMNRDDRNHKNNKNNNKERRRRRTKMRRSRDSDNDLVRRATDLMLANS